MVAFSELELLPALLTEENKIKTNQTKLMAQDIDNTQEGH